MLNSLLSFKLSENRKTRFHKNHKNTFGLKTGKPERGGTCPGATGGDEGCEDVCYACTTSRIYKNYQKVEDHNTNIILKADYPLMVEIIRNTVLKFLLGGGNTKQFFRLHMGGDFFNEVYARAWAHVMKEWPNTRFWGYTRSLFAIPILAEVKNLSIYLSCDPVNIKQVLKAYEPYRDYPNVAIAWMGDTFPEELLNDREYLSCPAVNKQTKSTKDYGACSRCRACIDRPLKTGKLRHIQFPIHK
jgi:hypothetical protein